jgi:hypothetical protein
MRIEVAAGSEWTGGKRGESTIEERILSNDGVLGVLGFSLQTQPTLHPTNGRGLNPQIHQARNTRFSDTGSLFLYDVPVVLNVVG